MRSSIFFLRNALVFLAWVMLFISMSDFFSYIFLFPSHEINIYCFYLLIITVASGVLLFFRSGNFRSYTCFLFLLFVWWVFNIFMTLSGRNEIDVKNNQLLNTFKILDENAYFQRLEGGCVIKLGRLKKIPIDPYSGDYLVSRYFNDECYIVSVGPDLRESVDIIPPESKYMVVYFNSIYWDYLILDKISYRLSEYSENNSKDIGMRLVPK